MPSAELLADFNGLAKNFQGFVYSSGFRESYASVHGCCSKRNKRESPLQTFNNSFRQLNGNGTSHVLLTLELYERQKSAGFPTCSAICWHIAILCPGVFGHRSPHHVPWTT
jgi:hypothetical protein